MDSSAYFKTVTAKVAHIIQKTDGSPDAVNEILPLLYEQLADLASRMLRRERVEHSLQSADLVNEVFIKLARQDRTKWLGKSHFMAISAQMMRRILIDHARSKGRIKRGGGKRRVDLDEGIMLSVQMPDDLLDLDEALDRLEEVDPRQARIVELKFFGGMTVQEISTMLNVSKRTVESEWTHVKAWLRREITDLETSSEETAEAE